MVELGTDLVLESPLDSPCTLLLTPISSWLNFKLTVAIFVPGCLKRDCSNQQEDQSFTEVIFETNKFIA